MQDNKPLLVVPRTTNLVRAFDDDRASIVIAEQVAESCETGAGRGR